MIFWVITFLICALISIFFYRTITQETPDIVPNSDLEVYKDQLVNIDKELSRGIIAIDEKANLLPCEILKVLSKEKKTDAPELGDFTFGNLRDYNFNPLLLINSERGKQINQFIRDDRCWCSFECAQIQNFTLDPSSYFQVIKNYISNNHY